MFRPRAGRRRAGVLTAVSVITLALGVSVLPGTAAATPALGAPHHVGIAVPDLDEAREQLAAGTGTRFGSVTSSTVSVKLAGESSARSVTLRRAYALRGEPFLALEQASPAIGPWAPPGEAAPTFLSYAVPDVASAGQALRRAGFELAATADDFAFWRGAGNVLVRLLDARSAPGREPGRPADDLGPIRSITFAPCDVNALKDQLTRALGMTWKTPMLVPLTWQYADGSSKPIVHEVHASQDRAPHVTIETPGPAQSCTPDRTPVHLVYFTPDVAAAERRAAASGMTFVGRAAPLVTYFRGVGGYYLEIGSTALQLAELVP